jgi:hypothetical protein
MPALALAEQDRHKGTLDEPHREFIRRSLRELIDELGDEQHVIFARIGAGPADRPKEIEENPKAPRRRGPIPDHCTINVITLAAHDAADEIVGLMLTQLLNFQGYCSTNVSTTALASEMVEAVTKHQAHVVVVSAMPPAAVTHSRYLCKRLHLAYPNLNMLVGLWTMKGNLQKARERITCVATVQVMTTLSEALDQIEQMAKPLLVTQPPPTKDQEKVA